MSVVLDTNPTVRDGQVTQGLHKLGLLVLDICVLLGDRSGSSLALPVDTEHAISKTHLFAVIPWRYISIAAITYDSVEPPTL